MSSSSPLLANDTLSQNSKPDVELPAVGRGSSGSNSNNRTSKAQLYSAEDTPAYAVLQSYDLLCTDFRKANFDDIFQEGDLEPNATSQDIYDQVWAPHFHVSGCFPLFVSKIYRYRGIQVPPGHVLGFVDENNNYIFAKPGNHLIKNPFITKKSNAMKVEAKTFIEHGNRTIVTVPQGQLGYATDMGQPVLLPPGLHSWTSETMRFLKMYKLDEHVIQIGPYTILTVDEGYSAITQNNGLQVVLDGGKTHLLSHQKWRFEKFITKKIQTDDLEHIRAASADNVVMSVDSTVVWRITDVRLAAVAAAETMAQGNLDVNADIRKLRRDVLKQAIASLASFIGSVNYSDSFHIAAAAQRNIETAEAVAVGSDHPAVIAPVGNQDGGASNNPMFDVEGMSDAVTHASQITSKFGVEIISINIISANPVDANLTRSLATGAVASAEALQAETQARGLAKAAQIKAENQSITRKIDADSEAAAILVRAKAEADAEMMRAEGSKQAEILRSEGSQAAAALIEKSKVAIDLEMMRASAGAIKRSDKFFFGQEPSYLSNIVMKAPEVASLVD